MKYLLYSFLLLTGYNGAAQAKDADLFKVTNGDKKLAPFERKYIQYIETKEGFIRFNSILTRTCKPITGENGNNWLIIQAYQSGNYINIDSSICEKSTLLPVAYNTHIQSDAYREKVSFSGTGITNTILYTDSSTSSTKPNQGRYNGVMTDDIVSCMPLAVGASFTINVVNPGVRFSEYTTTVTVEAMEEIDISGLGKIPCWRVRNGKGNNTTIEWYSVKEHIQVKKKFEMGNGNNFYRVLLAG